MQSETNAFSIISTLVVLLGLLGTSFAFRDYVASFLAFLVLKAKKDVKEKVRIKILTTPPIKGDLIKIGVLRSTLMEVGDGERLPSVRTGRTIQSPNYMLMFNPLLVYGEEIIDEVVAYVKDGDLKFLEKSMKEAICKEGCKFVDIGIYQNKDQFVIHGMYKTPPEIASEKRSNILSYFFNKLRPQNESVN